MEKFKNDAQEALKSLETLASSSFDMKKNIIDSASIDIVELVATIADMNTSYFDIDGSFLYFYKKVGSNEYLHRLVIDNGANVEEFVGVYLDVDLPETDAE